MPAERLAEQWRQAAMAAGAPVRDALATVDPAAALSAALAGGDGGPIVVAGSLYLVGAVRGQLLDDPLLGDPEE